MLWRSMIQAFMQPAAILGEKQELWRFSMKVPTVA